MPIRAEEKARYPRDWTAISLRIRHERAGNKCECTGQCGDEHDGGRCNAPNGEIIYRAKEGPDWALVIRADIAGWFSKFRTRGVKVVLTTMHLNHTPEDCADSNLLAGCQRCHLRYDSDHHAETRRRTRDKRSGQGALFGARGGS